MRRSDLWPLVIVLIGLALSGALLAGAFVASLAPGGAEEMPWVPLAVDKSLGVNADLARLDAAQREQALAAMEAAGFTWLRQRFPWDEIEARRGEYDWARWDEVIDAAVRQNLDIIAVLDTAPAWARAPEDAGNPLAPPVETRDFGDWAAAFAARYGDRINHYQVWDEPNIAPHWGAREIDPAAYARLLREGAVRVRAADPGAVILAAALAPNVETGGANVSEVQFLDALYRLGAAEWFDVVAAQPYGFGQPLNEPPAADRLNWRRVELLCEVMEAHGDAGTAVWATAFGWPGSGAEGVAAVVELARRDWPWLGPMLWTAWSPGDVHGEYALVDDAGTPGAVYGALARLAVAPVVASPGVYPPDHASGNYEGRWRVTPSRADIGQSGDTLTIPFHGTRLDLIVQRGSYRAFLYATVDGEPANALPRDDDGRAYVVLYDPLAAKDRVTLARGLAPGEHVAEIVAEGGWGQWALSGWAVAGGDTRARSPWVSFLLALLSAAVVGATVVHAWRRRFAVAFAAGTVAGTCGRAVDAYRALDPGITIALTAAAALFTYAMAGTLPTLATLGLLAFLLLLRPEAGLPLIAFSLPFSQLGRPLLGKMFSMTEILVVLTAVGWGAGRLVDWGLGKWGVREPGSEKSGNWGTGLRPVALDWGVVALVGVAAASLLWAEQGRVAAREFRTVVLEGALFYALIRLMVRDRQGVWRLADAWVAGAASIALVGIAQWLLGANVITADGVWRVRGFYGSPNNLALYLGRVLPLALVMGAWGRGMSAGLFGDGHSLRAALGTTSGRRRWAYAGAALVMVAAFFFTYSRGAWLVGLPISLLFLALMRGRRTFLVALTVLVVVAVIAAAALLLTPAGLGRLTSLLDTEQGTTFFRLQLWQSSLSMVRDHPLLGVGLDNFLYQYRTHYVLPTAWEEFDLSHPHNVLLDFWLRLGLPGLLVAGWLLAAFFRAAGRLYRALPAGDDRLLALGLLGGMVYFVAHGLVDNAFFLVDLAFSFMLVASLAATLSNTQYRISSTQYPISSTESSPCAS